MFVLHFTQHPNVFWKTALLVFCFYRLKGIPVPNPSKYLENIQSGKLKVKITAVLSAVYLTHRLLLPGYIFLDIIMSNFMFGFALLRQLDLQTVFVSREVNKLEVSDS